MSIKPKLIKKTIAILLMLPLIVVFLAGIVAWWTIVPEPFKSVLTTFLIITLLVSMFGTGVAWLDKLNKEEQNDN